MININLEIGISHDTQNLRGKNLVAMNGTKQFYVVIYALVLLSVRVKQLTNQCNRLKPLNRVVSLSPV